MTPIRQNKERRRKRISVQAFPRPIRAIRVIRGSGSALLIRDGHSRCSVAQFELHTQQDQLRKSRSRLTSLRRAVWLGRPASTRTSSATAGKSERELQWTCFHKVKRCGTPASAWLQRAWLGNADYSDQCLAKKLAVACPHLSGSSIHISCVAPGTVTCSA
jgi:hypothetical protein